MTLVALQVTAALVLLFSAISKTFQLGAPMLVLRKLGVPSPVQRVMGMIELVAVAGLLIGIWNAYLALAAAALICVLAAGSILLHVVRDPQPVRGSLGAALLLALGAVVLGLRWLALAHGSA
jgi:DoxX-like family